MSSLSVLLDDLIVECIHNRALIGIPKQVLVNSAETIVTVDYVRFNHSTLRRVGKERFLFYFNFIILLVLNRDKVVETKLFFFYLSFIMGLEAFWVFDLGSSRS